MEKWDDAVYEDIPTWYQATCIKLLSANWAFTEKQALNKQQPIFLQFT